MEQKHHRQSKIQDAFTIFQVEESVHLLNHLNQFLTRNVDARKAGEDTIVIKCSMRRHYLASPRPCGQKINENISVQQSVIRDPLQKFLRSRNRSAGYHS